MLRKYGSNYRGIAPLIPQSRCSGWELRCQVASQAWLPSSWMLLSETPETSSSLAWNWISESPPAKALAHRAESGGSMGQGSDFLPKWSSADDQS